METSSHGRFHAVVPTVKRFPLAIVLCSYIILAINLYGLINFFTNLPAFVPGIGTGPAVDQIAFMISGRQLGVALVLVFALLYKHVRVMQLAWLLAIIRELVDLALARNSTGSVIFVVAILIVEVAIFIHLGKIASGKVAKYRPASNPGSQ